MGLPKWKIPDLVALNVKKREKSTKAYVNLILVIKISDEMIAFKMTVASIYSNIIILWGNTFFH